MSFIHVPFVQCYELLLFHSTADIAPSAMCCRDIIMSWPVMEECKVIIDHCAASAGMIAMATLQVGSEMY
jgi:hypothetical protein